MPEFNMNDLEIFLLYVTRYASDGKPFSQTRLVEFVMDSRTAYAAEFGIPDGAIEKILEKFLRERKVSAFSRRGEEGGENENHFLISRVGRDALAVGIRQRRAADAMYRFTNQFYGIR